MSTALIKGLQRIGLYSLSIALFLIIWYIFSTYGPTGFTLVPPPTIVFQTLIKLISSGVLFEHARASLFRVGAGFLAAIVTAIPLGFLIGWYKTVKYLSDPILNLLRTTPPLAFIPLIIMYFGIGEFAKISVIWICDFFVLVIVVSQAVINTDATLIKAARVLGAQDRDIFLRIVVPASFPAILTGCRVAVGTGWMTLVAAELIAAHSGLGYMIEDALRYFNVDVIVAGIITIGVIGLAMDGAVRYIEKRLTGWVERAG
ncbi:MAG: ABC transporter permease [Candidatus Methanomethylicaceae archaeon]